MFTDEQLQKLEERFHKEQYLTRRQIIVLANELELNKRQVKVWFQNRRQKDKKEEMLENMEKSQVTCLGLPFPQNSASTSLESSPICTLRESPQPTNDHMRNDLMRYISFKCERQQSTDSQGSDEYCVQQIQDSSLQYQSNNV